MKRILLIVFIFLLVGCKNNEVNNIIQNSSLSTSINDITNDNNIQDSSNEIIENDQMTSEVEVSKQQYIFTQKYKIYINPSVQYHNMYANNISNEGVEMSRIANEMVKLFNEQTNLDIKCNCAIKGLSLSSSLKESNDYQADYHFAIHSNAGGGKGSEIFVSNNSYDFGQAILNSLNKILPYKSRGVKDGIASSLYEIKNSKAQAALIEILFHDEINQATFIMDNYQQIAKVMFEGIINYLLETQKASYDAF